MQRETSSPSGDNSNTRPVVSGDAAATERARPETPTIRVPIRIPQPLCVTSGISVIGNATVIAGNRAA